MLVHLFISHDGRPATRGRRIGLAVLLLDRRGDGGGRHRLLLLAVLPGQPSIAAPCRITARAAVLIDNNPRYEARPAVQVRRGSGSSSPASSAPAMGYEHDPFETADAAEAFELEAPTRSALSEPATSIPPTAATPSSIARPSPFPRSC